MTTTPPVLPLRRLGSSVVHLAAFQPESLQTLGWIGPPFPGTTVPVQSLCAATLNGTKVWMKNGEPCRRCRRLAEQYGHPIQYHEPEGAT